MATSMLTLRSLSHNAVRLSFVLSMAGAVAACTGGDMSDLRQYVEETKGHRQGEIEPLPEFEPYETFAYKAVERRSPFEEEIFGKPERQAKRSQSKVHPDRNREPELLENYPLDSLDMVGTLEREGQQWALVQDPEGTIHRVRPGNHMGQNNGKITNVTQTEIALVEIVPDGLGGWRKREAAIALDNK